MGGAVHLAGRPPKSELDHSSGASRVYAPDMAPGAPRVCYSSHVAVTGMAHTRRGYLMEASRFGHAIPLGTGLTIELVIDCERGMGWAAVVDYYYEETVKAPDFLTLADAVLATFFLEESAPSLRSEPIRQYRVAKGWTLEGWRSTFGARVAQEWQIAREEELILAA